MATDGYTIKVFLYLRRNEHNHTEKELNELLTINRGKDGYTVLHHFSETVKGRFRKIEYK